MMQIQSNVLLNNIDQRLDSIISQQNSFYLGAKFSELTQKYPLCKSIGVQPNRESELLNAMYHTFKKSFRGEADAFFLCDESFENCVLAVNDSYGPANNSLAVYKCISNKEEAGFFYNKCKDGINGVRINVEPTYIQLETFRDKFGKFGTIHVEKSGTF